MDKLKEKLKKIRKIFEIHCPDCGGKVVYGFYDPIHKINVYYCQECGKEWVLL